MPCLNQSGVNRGRQSTQGSVDGVCTKTGRIRRKRKPKTSPNWASNKDLIISEGSNLHSNGQLRSHEDSDDCDTGYNMESERLLMRAWFTRQVAAGDIPGLVWHDPERTMIRIPWVHGSRQTWDKNKHSELFRRWAEYTGRYDNENPDAKKWKANFRCALNSLPDIFEVPHLRKKGQNAYKVYKLTEPKRRDSIVIRSRNTTRRSTPSNCMVPKQEQMQAKIEPGTEYMNDAQFCDDRLLFTHSSNLPQGSSESVRPTQGPYLDANDTFSSSSSASSDDESQPRPDHPYAHVVPPRRYNTANIPETVVQMGVDPIQQEVAMDLLQLYRGIPENGQQGPTMDYALDGSCSSPEGNASMDYSDYDYHQVAEYLKIVCKDLLPEEIQVQETPELTVLQPVNFTSGAMPLSPMAATTLSPH